MEALKRSREETEKAREEAGILDDVVISNDIAVTSTKGKGKADEANAIPAPKITGRGIDKRKRELEERRKAIEAKRRKTNGAPAMSIRAEGKPARNAVAHSGSSKPEKGDAEPNASSTAADDFLTKLEADLLRR